MRPDPNDPKRKHKYIQCICYVIHNGKRIAYHGSKKNPYYEGK